MIARGGDAFRGSGQFASHGHFGTLPTHPGPATPVDRHEGGPPDSADWTPECQLARSEVRFSVYDVMVHTVSLTIFPPLFPGLGAASKVQSLACQGHLRKHFEWQ